MLVGGGLQGVQLAAHCMQRLPALLQLRQPLLPGEHALQGGACTPSSWSVNCRGTVIALAGDLLRYSTLQALLQGSNDPPTKP